MAKSRFLSLFLFYFTFITSNQLNAQSMNWDKLDSFIQTTYDSIRIVPGVAIGVVVDGEVVFKKSYGYSNIERNEPLTNDTQFYIASTTKSFTALAASILEQKGLLNLDKSLAYYFPNVAFPDSIQPAAITLNMLLSHTSGIDNSNISFPKSQSGEYTNKQLFDLLEKTFGRVELGEYRYSNLGYNIMNLIFLKEFGKTWGEIVQEEVLDPLGMDHTYSSYIRLLENNEKVATNYFSLGDGDNLFKIHQREKRSDATLHAAGGLFTNLNDIVKWVQLQTNFTNSETQYGISTKAITNTREEIANVEALKFGFDKEVYSYGLGWNIGNFRNTKIYFHGGAYGGHRAMISYIPELNAGVVVMTNDSFSGNGVNYKISSFIYDALLNSNSNSDWSNEYYDWIDQFTKETENFGLETVRKDIANRATREYKLTVTSNKLTGIYFNQDDDAIRIYLINGNIHARQGDLIGGVEPFVNENTIRLDLERVGVLKLDIQENAVIGFTYLGEYYKKY